MIGRTIMESNNFIKNLRESSPQTNRLSPQILEAIGLLSEVTTSTISQDVERFLQNNKINVNQKP
jgi:hypothetical protein